MFRIFKGLSSLSRNFCLIGLNFRNKGVYISIVNNDTTALAHVKWYLISFPDDMNNWQPTSMTKSHFVEHVWIYSAFQAYEVQ